jgi:Tol biopolymer transport system component
MWGERRNSYYVGWVKDGRLLVFDGTEGSVYAGKPANLQMLRCKLAPTAYNGSFSPDGNRLIADYFDRKHPNRVHFVYMYDLKTGERRLLYRGPSLPYPAEWSDDGKYAMVVLSGEGERPLVVGPDGKVRRAQITSISSKASTIPDSWLACSAGGVFLSPDLIACVEQEKKGNAERIVRVAILGNDER